MALIKRYPNRKLYDTEAKRYVTLDDVTQMIREGHEVQVIDHETNEDLTNLTLTQIILEQEKKSAAGFVPRALLTGLIRAGGDTLEQVRRSLPAPLSNYGSGHGEGSLEEQAGKAIEQGRAMVDQIQALLRVEDRLADVLHLLNVPTRREVQALHEQIATLNARLEQALNRRQAANNAPTVPTEDEAAHSDSEIAPD
jgi:polyhydroxyalkanoate synthesis repressor PhaR